MKQLFIQSSKCTAVQDKAHTVLNYVFLGCSLDDGVDQSVLKADGENYLKQNRVVEWFGADQLSTIKTFIPL